MAEGHDDGAILHQHPVLSVELQDAACVVRLAGELDLYNANDVREALFHACADGPERLVVDLGEVEFVDSTALGVLIEARTKLANKRAFLLAAPRLEPSRALEISGLDRHFSVHESVPAALAAKLQEAADRSFRRRAAGEAQLMRRALVIGAAGVSAGEAVRRRLTGYDLRGKTALVTGGSRGLGFAIASRLVDEGARVVICARDPERLERARMLLAERGGDVRAIRCDVGDREQVERLVAEVGHIDALFNVAGVIGVGPITTQSVEDFREQHDIMFWGVVYATLAVLPQMLERGDGRIANITSIGGKISVPYLLPYNAAKFAAVGFSEGLRAELRGKGVVVTTVVPGLMRTGSYVAALFKGRRETLYKLFTPISTLPFSAMSGRRAARKIVAAVKRGDPELILTLHANLAARANGIAPATTQRVLSVVARVLPDGGATEPLAGKDIGSAIDESLLTALGRRARADLNQP